MKEDTMLVIIMAVVGTIMLVLGIIVDIKPLTLEEKQLVLDWQNARKEKNFALADELRDKISEMGYIIEETRQGTKVTKK